MRPDDFDNRSNFQASRLQFLGAEFLTWLYFWLLQNSQVGKARIVVGKKITLKPLEARDFGVAVASPFLDDSGEVLQAVRAGAHVDSLALEVVIGEAHYQATLNASDAAFTAVQIGKSFANDQEDDQRLEADLILRTSALDEIEKIIDELFGQFLERRLKQTFGSQDISQIRENVASGLAAKLPKGTSASFTSHGELTRGLHPGL